MRLFHALCAVSLRRAFPISNHVPVVAGFASRDSGLSDAPLPITALSQSIFDKTTQNNFCCKLNFGKPPTLWLLPKFLTLRRLVTPPHVCYNTPRETIFVGSDIDAARVVAHSAIPGGFCQRLVDWDAHC